MAQQKTITIDSEENDDWMKALPGYKNEIRLHDDLEKKHTQRKHTATVSKAKIRLKAIQDAPNYRQAPAITYKRCKTCRHFDQTTSHCHLFDFQADPEYVCDSWEEIP